MSRPSAGRVAVHGVLAVVLTAWVVPVIGLLVASFRTASATNESGWWTALALPLRFTLDNYGYVLERAGFWPSLVNSIAIAVPATVLTVLLSSVAAYVFAWMRFPGRDALFVVVIGLLVVPLQVTIIPVLALLRDLPPDGIEINGTVTAVWLAHTGYGLPFGIFLMRSSMGALPRDVFEAASIDGAGHLTAFVRLALPLSLPGVASLVIFQFLWVWNDLFVSLVYLGPRAENHPLPVTLANLTTNFGGNWQYVTAAAFVSTIVPVVVFLALQRQFVRGIVAGAVRG